MGEIKVSPSRREALEMYNKRFSVTMKNKVYVVMRQSDTCSGNGPMVLDKVFSNRSLANQYVDNTPGVQGRICKWSEQKYGDFDIHEMEVIEELLNHPDHEIIDAVRKCQRQYQNVNSLSVDFIKAYVVGLLKVHPKDYISVVDRVDECIKRQRY